MKKLEDCHNIQDIRDAIDFIDSEIIEKFGARLAYVKAAAQFKKNTAEVKAKSRFDSMIEQRRVWAENNGLNPDVIEKLYQDLVSYFIEEELQNWKK